LHLVEGRFASRHAHRLSYAAQNIDELGRARKQRRKLRASLNGEGSKPRPRGRHRYKMAERLRRATLTERALFAQLVQGQTGRRR
jgi:hypothetical protein